MSPELKIYQPAWQFQESRFGPDPGEDRHPNRSSGNSKPPVTDAWSRLSHLTESIIQEDTSIEALKAWINLEKVSNPELIRLVDFLNDKAQKMLYGEHPVKMFQFAHRAATISEHLEYAQGRAYGLMYMGVSKWFTSNLDQSLRHLATAKKIFINLSDRDGEIKTLTFEASVYRSMGDYDQSYLSLSACIEYFRNQKDHFWEATALLSMGMTYAQIGDVKGVLRSNRRIIRIIDKPELRWIVGRALDSIGTVYFKSGRHGKGLEYYRRSLLTCQESSHPVGEARALNDLGVAYQEIGEAGKAIKYFRESLRIRREVGQREAQCTCLFNLGKLAIMSKKAESAQEYLLEALSIATEVGAKPRISQAHKNLSRVYELIGDFEKALHHHKLFHKINQEVSLEQTNTRAQNLKTRLELDKAEKVSEIERQKNDKLNEKNEELEELLHHLRRTQTQLVQAEKMAVLGKLVAGVTHEMNSPLGASNSSIDISERCITQITDLLNTVDNMREHEAKQKLEKLLNCLLANNSVIAKANRRISKVVHSLKSFSNLDEAPFQKADIHEGLNNTITLLDAELGNRIKIVKKFCQIEPIGCYPGELNQVFLNLLSNSIEAIENQGEITIETSPAKRGLQIKICDDGVGIPKDKLQTLFDPEFSGKQARIKAGMGLFICQNIVQKHQGHIMITSEINKGTKVSITLPIELETPERHRSTSA